MSEPDKSSGGAARGAVRLAMARNWVNRRIETFSFLDAETVRCRMSIDLTLPAMSFVAAGDFVFVPLLALTKRDLRNLDVRGPDDRPLPVLTTEQNAEAVVRGIKEQLTPLLPPGTALDADHERKLREIVEARDVDGLATAYLRSGAPMGLLLDRVSDDLVRKEIERLLKELESAFLLLVPLEYQPNRRIVCKVSYDVARERGTVATKSDRRYATVLSALASLGLLGRSEVLDCVAFGLCESYHAEVIPPKDAYVAETSLTVCRQRDGSSEGRLETTRTDDQRFRSHLRAVPATRGDTATLTVVLHAYRQELLFPLAFSGLLISVVLALLPAHVYAIDAQTVAALLLVPFALSAYYIRGQDNSYVTRETAWRCGRLSSSRFLSRLEASSTAASRRRVRGFAPGRRPRRRLKSPAVASLIKLVFPNLSLPVTVEKVGATLTPAAGEGDDRTREEELLRALDADARTPAPGASA
jgi:hypothetical protein